MEGAHDGMVNTVILPSAMLSKAGAFP